MKIFFDLHKIKKSYIAGGQTYDILKGIDLSINEGGFVAIMGPSGSGKSTLLNIIGCLDIATSGTYVLNQKDISLLDKRELATIRNKFIGFIFQNFNLINSLSVLQNVLLPAFYKGDEDINKAMKLLKSVGLEEKANFKPNELSGGQKQRVAIARSLINDPDILLADEPTGALDSKTGKEIMDIIVDLNQKQKKTIIMVTHDKNVASLAHKIINLKDGLIV